MSDGSSLHPECMLCASCNLGISGGYVKDEGKMYCDSDCASAGPMCADPACRAPLSGTISKIGPRRYHSEHVRCSVCRIGLAGDEIKAKSGVLFCEQDWNLKYGEFCHACSKYTSPEGRLKAMGFYWHPECFVCAACSSSFADGVFVVSAGKPYCNEECAGV